MTKATSEKKKIAQYFWLGNLVIPPRRHKVKAVIQYGKDKKGHDATVFINYYDDGSTDVFAI